jgi:imidazolonepropionase-like amidohydrolase
MRSPKPLLLLLILLAGLTAHAQQDSLYLLKPDRVFDGENMRDGWQVLVRGNKIEAVGALKVTQVPAAAKVIEMRGYTLMPGLIEGHSHFFLHPYNETEWDDQVLKESRAERTARAVNHARLTLMAGFTTVRDLGTEGAGYDDVGLKQAIEKGVIPGPRMIIATRAIVATGSYGPKVLQKDWPEPVGAAEADGLDALVKEVRTQIGNGADLIKVYADYRWGQNETTMPTFTESELATVVEVAGSSGRQVVAHANGDEAIRRAVNAGVATIEHGNDATADIFKLMKERRVALVPTIAALEASEQYKGYKRGPTGDPEKIAAKKNSFKAALKSGVTICFGSDAGVFPHGENVREMELMVFYGMDTKSVLKSATSVNADVFKLSDKLGRLKPGLLADIIAVEGDPLKNISFMRKVKFIMKNGVIVMGR